MLSDEIPQMVENVGDLQSDRTSLIFLPEEEQLRQPGHLLQANFILVDIQKAKGDVLILEKRSDLLKILIERLGS